MKKKRVILGILLTVLIIGGFGFFIFSRFFTRTVRVSTGSMLNTIIPGDHVLVQKFLGEPSHGDIVMYQHEKGADSYIARIIGLPGETIQVKGDSVYINGSVLEEERVTVEEDEELRSAERDFDYRKRSVSRLLQQAFV